MIMGVSIEGSRISRMHWISTVITSDHNLRRTPLNRAAKNARATASSPSHKDGGLEKLSGKLNIKGRIGSPAQAVANIIRQKIWHFSHVRMMFKETEAEMNFTKSSCKAASARRKYPLIIKQQEKLQECVSAVGKFLDGTASPC